MPSTQASHLSAPVSPVDYCGPADPAGPRVVSRDLSWEDPITGERLGIRFKAGAGLLRRLRRDGFEEAEAAPGRAIPSGPGVAA